MEVTLKAGDSLQIPEGCRAVIKDNVVVFEKASQNGDVLHSIYDREVLIFKNYTNSTYFSSHYNYSGKDNNMWRIDCFRHATDEEKQLLFDKMKEQGLQWNAEEKRVEKVRWRAKEGEEYYYVGNQGIVIADEEDGYSVDKIKHEFGNYFRTYEQAKEAARRMNEDLLKYHEEIGE